MSSPSPLSQPEPWNLVSPGYVDILLPEFTKYARKALEQVAPAETAHVLDVATGPGTFALLAAAQVQQVTGIDFAHDMLNAARKHAAEQGLRNVEFHEGDAQTLPFPDNTFDAAFSIFGLIFFPNRIQGLKEMRRVLKPGGKVGLTSWVPFKEVPLIEAVFTVIAQHLSTPFGSDGPPPLGTPELIHEEFSAAGFANVDVKRIENTVHEPSLHAYWESMVRSTAPLTLLRKRLGDGWAAFEQRVFADLQQRFGAGPVSVTMPAWLTVASNP
ncbi:MAG: methyltransferase domain-containing protein [Deltaproteobacteria bacterium]|nr:methyltransferase domain-containing protein [Deltaproteobacteria bacterium]